MKRPLSVTLIAALFIIAGISGIVYHLPEWKQFGFHTETVWPFVVRLIAIVAGIFLLKASNVARWVLLGWILYHVGLSLFHSTSELLMHIAVTIVVVVALFNTRANQYFK
jgi:uncharacterized membrane protein HdeD (DUF308 family)